MLRRIKKLSKFDEAMPSELYPNPDTETLHTKLLLIYNLHPNQYDQDFFNMD